MSKIIFEEPSDPKINEIKKISKLLTNSDSNCNQRCKLSAGYGLSSCKVKRGLGYIEMSYDSNVSNILFNNVKYSVSQARLYCGPVHQYGTQKLFNGDYTPTIISKGPNPDGMSEKKIQCELIIEHEPHESYGVNLLLCIPVCIGSTHSLLDDIITETSDELGQQKSLSLSNYNFSQFVPSTQYYYYYDRNPVGKPQDNVHCICFDPKTFVPPTITESSFNQMYKMMKIKPYTEKEAKKRKESKFWNDNTESLIVYNTVDEGSTTTIYINHEGMNTEVSEDIYIDCKPTGEEVEPEVTDRSNEFQRNFGKMLGLAGGAGGKIPTKKDIMNSPGFVYVFGVLAFFVVWKVWNMFGAKIKGKPLMPRGLKPGDVKTGATVIKAQKL